MPECSESDLLGFVPPSDEQRTHRQFELPVLTYPYGTDLEVWGLTVRAKIDEAGRVRCYDMKGQWDNDVKSNPQRAALRAALGQWRYQPFLRAGKPVVAVVTEDIDEQEAAKAHVPLPEVPLDHVQITLVRTGCYGTCPSYRVDVYGDGRVVYSGNEYVDVTGEHIYRIPRERVAGLVESLRVKDLWSLRESYRATVTDNPVFGLKLRLGDQEHRIEDYVGQRVGMPRVVSEFEREIDEASGTQGFVNLSGEAVERLKQQGFDFRSQAGADLLANAVANQKSRDDQAMLRVVELGAPTVTKADVDGRHGYASGSLLEHALRNGRTALLDALSERGALQTNGAPDQSKIDAAFRGAVAGGRLEAVEKLWAMASSQPHPSLMFEDATDYEPSLKKRVPVTLLYKEYRRDENAGEQLALIKWLEARGCDLTAAKADGDTLLHIAARNGNAELVRYLLSQGLDANAPGRYSTVPLASTATEDVALLLLEAGAEPWEHSDSRSSFQGFAQYRHWDRVIAWLDAH